jgi:cellulose synthase/poly-beta-1,6-N-acetylglucosamine synthase-like glycosyltransferase
LELSELLWAKRQRAFTPLTDTPVTQLPKVSIHLAIHNEPPEMVKRTLDHLARLDYPDFEVLVVDNNTKDAAVWQPVEAHCALLGKHFRFFHLPNWPGYKAGALNFALRETHPDAEVIGVIDSDYVVRPDWLRALVPYFATAKVGFVQAPQDNREWNGDVFKTLCNWEYRGFFDTGMVHRNERDAIIQHGTMTLIRTTALRQLQGWSEWCICEDAELGLRMYEQGYTSVYVNQDFGHGLVPESFAAYKIQRFRWAFGAMQILRSHWSQFWSPTSGLTLGQRFHFLGGWLPWVADAMHLLFTFAAVFWTVGLTLFPEHFDFPLTAFLVPTLGMFIFKVAHALVLYKTQVQCGLWERLGAAMAGMSLTHTIARAVWQGMFISSKPFFRTPKGENKPALIRALLMAWEELQMLSLLWLAILATYVRYGDQSEALVWMLVLAAQSMPYLAALGVSLANSVPDFSVSLGRIPVLARRTALNAATT